MLQDIQQKKYPISKKVPKNGLKYFVETYGCQMNEYDSELVGKILGDLGYSKSHKIEEADAIFLNTCSIREKAEENLNLAKKAEQQIEYVQTLITQNLEVAMRAS